MSIPLTSVVVEPDRQTARQWAVEELSGAAYARAQPNLVERAIVWVLDRLNRALDAGTGAGGGVGLLVGLIVVVLVVALAILLAGPLRPGGLPGRRADVVFGATVRTAAEHRAEAERAAAEQSWARAVQERFRAAARTLEERVVLDRRPGRTADEVAVEGGIALPGGADALRIASRAFDDVTYGERPGDEAGYRACVDADEAAQRERPSGLLAPVDAGPGSAGSL